jgi:HAD domain in Swiss Army Knife RNA repair proteins
MTTPTTMLPIDPKIPTIYLGFSSVFHRGEGLLNDDGTVVLDSGETPFDRAHLLVDALAPYPDTVQLVLTTAWVRTLGEERTVALLPVPLRPMVVGTTHSIKPRLGELLDGTARSSTILRHVARFKIEYWTALGDDFYGVPFELEHRFLTVLPETGLLTPAVLPRLRAWLSAVTVGVRHGISAPAQPNERNSP